MIRAKNKRTDISRAINSIARTNNLLLEIFIFINRNFVMTIVIIALEIGLAKKKYVNI